MPKAKSLFSVGQMVSKKDTPVEVSFLQDFDYTLRKMNEHKAKCFFKKIELSSIDNSEKQVNIVCLDVLPETCDDSMMYSKTGIVYHTNDQAYYIVDYYDGKPSRHYKPSSMNCTRQMYYQIIGASLDKQLNKTSEFYGICESGTDRHKRIQNVLCQMKDYGVDCEYIDVETYIKENNLPLEVLKKEEFETKVFDPKLNLVFLCDGLLKYHGKMYVFECKTESSYKFGERQYIADVHRHQAYTYALEFGIEDVLFLYENRDLCTKKSYILHVTDENKKYIENRIDCCESYVKSNIVPPKNEVNPKVCQYCEYRTQCKVDKS